MGQNQFVVLYEHGSVLWLEWLVQDLPADAPLWPSTGLKFRQLFSEVLRMCGLEGLRLTPGCCRPGGATWFYTEGIDVQRLQFMGRWKSSHSLTAYVQEAMSFLVWLELPVNIRNSLAAAIRLTAPVWASPPAVALLSLGRIPREWRQDNRRLPAPPATELLSWKPPKQL